MENPGEHPGKRRAHDLSGPLTRDRRGELCLEAREESSSSQTSTRRGQGVEVRGWTLRSLKGIFHDDQFPEGA